MKVEVIRQFKDLHSGEIHKVGDTLVINKKRFEEIQTAPFIYVKEIKAVKANDA